MVRANIFVNAALALSFVPACQAGPLLFFIIPFCDAIAPVSGLPGAGAFVVDTALYWSTSAAFYQALLIELPVGIKEGLKAKDKKQKEAASSSASSWMMSMASVSNASLQSVASVHSASEASVLSVSEASVASVHAVTRSEIGSSVAAAQASAESLANAATQEADCTAGPFTSLAHCDRSSTVSKRDVGTVLTTPTPTTNSAASPTPDDFLNSPPGTVPPGVPASVPAYNFDMCKADLSAQTGNNSVTMYSPSGQPNSIRVDNVPPTCMVLASVLLGDPSLEPHPVPMGSASLQWDNCNGTAVQALMGFLGKEIMVR